MSDSRAQASSVSLGVTRSPARYVAPDVPPLNKRYWGRAFARCLLLSHFRVETFGRHNLPRRGPVVVLGNHPTYWDPWIVSFCARRWITWMAWEEAFGWPVIGWLMNHMGAFPMNTGKPSPSSFKAAYAILEQQRILGIFPEGARTIEGDGLILDPLRPGAARIALKTGAPIVPVSVSGARRLWPTDRPLPGRGKVWVHFHPPIDTGEYTSGSMREREAHLIARVTDAISSALPPNGMHRFA